MTPNCLASSTDDPQSADGQVGLVFAVVVYHPPVVHFVNMIAGQDDDVFGTDFLNRIDVLINGVGGSLVPLFVNTLLRRHHIEELAQLAAEEPLPAQIDVPVEAHRLVLRQH